MKMILSRVNTLFSLFFLTLSLFYPFDKLFASTSGDVIINEVMWADEEWIELYNNTEGNIDIAGWKIENAKSNRNALEIKSGTIPANGYFLICDNNFKKDYCSIYDSISLNNDYKENGELILRDKNNNIIVDQTPLPQSNKWPAGEEEKGNKYSMERVKPIVLGEESCNWKTSQNSGGTPKTKNSQYSDIDCRILEADAGPEIFSSTDKDITFDASLSKGLVEKYTWNFGDGKTAEGKIISHKYEKSGEYIVSLNITSGGKENKNITKVAVFSDSIFLSEFSPKQVWFEISNEGDFVEDISGFAISTKNEKGTGFVFPENSFIASNGVLFISSNLLSGFSFGDEGSLFLFYPSGDIKQEIKYVLPAEVDDNWSISRKGSDYFYTKIKTPGKQNLLSGENKESSSGSSSSVSTTGTQGVSKVPQETKETQKPLPARRIFSSNLLAQVKNEKMVLAFSGFGIMLVSGFFGLNLIKWRRKMKRNWRQVTGDRRQATGNLQIYNSQQTTGGKQEKEIIELEIEH